MKPITHRKWLLLAVLPIGLGALTCGVAVRVAALDEAISRSARGLRERYGQWTMGHGTAAREAAAADRMGPGAGKADGHRARADGIPRVPVWLGLLWAACLLVTLGSAPWWRKQLLASRPRGRKRRWLCAQSLLSLVALAGLFALPLAGTRLRPQYEEWTDAQAWEVENRIINESNRRKRGSAEDDPVWRSKGFPVGDEKARGQRILVIGDSAAWGSGYANLNDVWWRQLQRALRRRGYWDVEVVAACRRKASIRDQLRWMRDGGLYERLRPDLILWGYRPSNADLGVPRTGSYPEWELSLLTGPNFEAYQRVVEELGQFRRSIDVPLLVVTLPKQPSKEYFGPRFDKAKPLFERAGIPFHDLLGSMIAKYRRRKPWTLTWSINPANGHPGTRATHFFAEAAADVLEADYAPALGPCSPSPPPDLRPAINDWAPAALDVREVAEGAWTFAYPTDEESMPYMPLRRKHVLLSFELPVALDRVEIRSPGLRWAELHASVIDEGTGFDHGDLHAFGARAGPEAAWPLTDEPAARHVNTLRLALEGADSSRSLGTVTLRIAFGQTRYYAAREPAPLSLPGITEAGRGTVIRRRPEKEAEGELSRRMRATAIALNMLLVAFALYTFLPLRRPCRLAATILVVVIALASPRIRAQYCSWRDLRAWQAETSTISYNNFRKVRNTDEDPVWRSAGHPVEDRKSCSRRILVIGDSVAWGSGCANMNDVWWRQLRRELRRRGYWDVEVVAACRSSASTQDQLQWLREGGLAARLQPDAIVCGYVTDDPDLGVPRTGSYPEWELSLLEGPNFEGYQRVVAELGQFRRSIECPLLVVTLPKKPSLAYFGPRYAKVAPVFERAGIPFHDILDELVAKYGKGRVSKLTWQMNPACHQPGTRAAHFFAQAVADVLEAEHTESLGSRSASPPEGLRPAINDWMPTALDVKEVANGVWRLAHPADDEHLLYMPLRTKHVLLSFELPVAVERIEVRSPAMQRAELFASVVDPQLGFDDGRLYAFGERSGATAMWNLSDEPAAGHVNTLRLALEGEKGSAAIGAVTLRITFGANRFYAAQEPADGRRGAGQIRPQKDGEGERAVPHAGDWQEASLPDVEQAISKGLSFLHSSQLPYGEFRMCFWTERGEPPMLDSSPFVTTFVLHSIGLAQDRRVEEMTEKAIRFLLAEKQANGVWTFWSSRNDNWDKKLPPDLDDTVMASRVLRDRGIPVDNLDLVCGNQDEDGRFYTWVADQSREDRIDSVVNANVLFYLGENESTEGAIAYLNRVVAEGKEIESTYYYSDPLSLYYCIARAYASGVASLAKSRHAIVDRTRRRQKKDGSLGDELLTGLAACALLDLHHRGSAINGAIQSLLATQGEDGSWHRAPFFAGKGGHWGSEELTTAIAVEALVKYRSRGKGR